MPPSNVSVQAPAMEGPSAIAPQLGPSGSDAADDF